MDASQVPAAMVEAAARELAIADGFSPDEIWTNEVFEWERISYIAAASAALAAALSVCEARREWRGLVPVDSVPPSVNVQPWSSFRFFPRGGTYERRWVFTTPAEPVPDNGGET